MIALIATLIVVLFVVNAVTLLMFFFSYHDSNDNLIADFIDESTIVGKLTLWPFIIFALIAYGIAQLHLSRIFFK